MAYNKGQGALSSAAGAVCAIDGIQEARVAYNAAVRDCESVEFRCPPVIIDCQFECQPPDVPHIASNCKTGCVAASDATQLCSDELRIWKVRCLL